ncbi:sugar kinase [Schumannella luteola]|uniref:2-dehydro-3-deoxygluconokinase n=1 Tax=Schumannella luteola TaxID=472059 RepID=A0A852YF83_9MICO|nr:2-dehydro-3-deoxygluconokinase [Schumannella luteola]TPW90594.1 sugar kinase [Schumannella luteola]
MTRVAAIGECMIEVAVGDDGAAAIGFAGDTFNTAVYLRRLLPSEARVQYLTGLGDDWLSEQQAVAMQGEGIELEAHRVSDASPGLYLVRNDAAGERFFTYYRDASPARGMFGPGWDAEVAASIDGADLVVFSAVTVQILTADGRRGLGELLARLRRAGATIAFDANYRQRGWRNAADAQAAIDAAAAHADLVLPSLDDERLLRSEDATPESVGEHYLHLGAREVVVTDGPGEVTVIRTDGVERIRTTPDAAPVDTTGAGDAFDAGYLAARLAGRSGLDAARSGQALAGLVIRHRGAIVPRSVSLEGVL